MAVYNEIWAGPGRNYKQIDGSPQLTSKWYVTIHNTSNDGTAREEAAYARTRTDGVGAHYFIDNIEVLQSTDTDWCVGHVGSTEGNTRGISYEITGVNGWTRQQWLSNVAWDKLAAVIARDCTKYGIPVRLLTLDQMRAFNSSTKGFVTHNMCRLAWGGTTHDDPGSGFPMDHLLALVGQMIGDDMGWQDSLTLSIDGKPVTAQAQNWLMGANEAAWKTYFAVRAEAAADATRDAAVLAAVTALANAGGADAAPIVAQIKAEADATRALVTEQHQAEMAALRAERDAEVAGLRAELAALGSTQN